MMSNNPILRIEHDDELFFGGESWLVNDCFGGRPVGGDHLVARMDFMRPPVGKVASRKSIRTLSQMAFYLAMVVKLLATRQ